jgi:hypothetical protein
MAPSYRTDLEPGLCGACRQASLVVSLRGGRFLQCRRSFTDPDYPRYPRLPVHHCRGYEPSDEAPPEDGEPR